MRWKNSNLKIRGYQELQQSPHGKILPIRPCFFNVIILASCFYSDS